MKKIVPINTTADGCAFTIVTRYEGRAYLKSMTGGGLYCDMSNNPSFARAGLPGISRTIKAEMHDAAVVVEYETDEGSDI